MLKIGIDLDGVVSNFAFRFSKNLYNYCNYAIRQHFFETFELLSEYELIGILFNADVNGGIGILRKVVGDGFLSILDRGNVSLPLKLNII